MAIDKEQLLDFWDNIVDVLRFGKWWQRVIVLGLPLSVMFAIFWFRPLPDEIRQKIAYIDKNSNVLYAEGVASVTDEHYTYVTPDGQEQTWKRSTWKDKLKDIYGEFLKNRWRNVQNTEHETFYWRGLNSLVQTVIINRDKIAHNGKVLQRQRYRVIYTWTKRENGWFITRAQLLPDRVPREP